MIRNFPLSRRRYRLMSSFLNAKDLLMDTHAVSVLPTSLAATKTVPAAVPDVVERAFRTGTNLAKYAVNLNKLAEEEKLEEVVGREKEIQQAIQVLSRRRKNNPCLVGEPGVGKTCIAEGLAILINQGRVPQSVRNKVIISLDLPSMLAGTKFRGEFEERLKGVIKEVEQCEERIVLFIDEVHILVGAGGSEGSIDAANILKPSLSRGTLRCIGTTTTEEYRKNIEKDPALARRFQSVFISEPSEKDTIEILKGLRPKYEQHHRIRLPDVVLSSIVSLASRYLPMKRFPDKAIDLMDEASARLRLQLESPPCRLTEIDEQIQMLHANAAASHSGELTVKEELILHKLEEERKPLQYTWSERNRLWDEIAKLQLDLQTMQRNSASQAARYLQQLTQQSVLSSPSSKSMISSSVKLLEKSPDDIKQLQQKHAQLHQLYQQLHEYQQILKQLTESNSSAPVKVVTKESEDIVGDAIDVLRVEDVAQIISEALDVPIHSVTGPDEIARKRLLKLEETLSAQVIGQNSAIHKIARAIKVSRAGLRGGDRPIGVFMLLGPTGVGKTELAKALAAELFPDRPAMDRFLRLDMSEFMEKFNVSRLTGAPPGYIGHEDGGRLTEAVKQRPYQLILFDEFEKAHRDVSQLLLQVFDAGRLTDASGTTVDFTNTVLIMTSNLGANILYPNQTTRDRANADNANEATDSDAKAEEDKEASASSAYSPTKTRTIEEVQALALQIVQQQFSPEFVNRLDDILVFQPLSDEAMQVICGLQIRKLQELLISERNLTLSVSSKAQKTIASRGGDSRFGARPLKRYLQTEVMAPLAEILLEGNIRPGDSICLHHNSEAHEIDSEYVKLVIANSDLTTANAGISFYWKKNPHGSK